MLTYVQQPLDFCFIQYDKNVKSDRDRINAYRQIWLVSWENASEIVPVKIDCHHMNRF